VGGMLSATVLAIFFVPLFFFVVKRLFRQDPDHNPASGPASDAAGDLRPQEA
jgi:multidrug efflux pump